MSVIMLVVTLGNRALHRRIVSINMKLKKINWMEISNNF